MPEYDVEFDDLLEEAKPYAIPPKGTDTDIPFGVGHIYILSIYGLKATGWVREPSTTYGDLDEAIEISNSTLNWLEHNKETYYKKGYSKLQFILSHANAFTCVSSVVKCGELELKPKNKIYINGPKANKEFLAKKGKHYV